MSNTEEIKIEAIDEMLEEDEELFELEDDDMKQKAFNLGVKLGQIKSSKPFKIGTKIIKGAALAAVVAYAYKKGIEAGVDSIEIKDIDSDPYDDPELRELELLELEAEESTEEQ